MNRRFRAAYAGLAVAALVLAAAGAWLLAPRPAEATCSERIPAGPSTASAWRTAELFVADVILARRPGRDYDLATRGLVVLNAEGRPELTMMVGLSTPRAGRSACDLALVVENGSWRVDRVQRIAIVDQ